MRDFEVVAERVVGRLRGAGTTPTRLFHGRGQTVPGFEDVTVDWFAPCLLVSAYGSDVEGPRRLARRLAQCVAQAEGVCLQLRDGRQTRAEVVSGRVPAEHVVCEDGLRYRVRIDRNQNVGLFLDMAPARCWLREEAAGQRVLNLFAYTCAFSVSAVAGGASLVVNNDMSRPALQWGQDNHRLNGQDPQRVRMLPHNLFKSWWKIRQLGPYDRIIIDPPTSQRGSFVAAQHYGQVLKRIPGLAAPGALVLACLNSPFLDLSFLPEQMAHWSPDCRQVASLLPSPDFPDRSRERALKLALFRYQP